MAKIKRRGKAGAAKAYITRTSAVKKLQISLADFRRLCILKGIFPREPRHRKRANKGSSAPTSFYYTKDIAYLAHEPVLKKLREHKAFAKRLSRALGRGEWSSAKSLAENNKPVYKLDHIIKERYPTFIDAVRDIDDALCMVFLFASLPSDGRIQPALVENCARLAAEWQLYVMHTRALRKVFLSIKGVYYQAEVADQTITWLVPYQFTQSIPTDVDTRVMLTFLELYQTLLGFVFFKLYTDANLIYPPPLDTSKDELAAGINAFNVRSADVAPTVAEVPRAKAIEVNGKKVSGKDVRQTIKNIAAASSNVDVVSMKDGTAEPLEANAEVEEDFVVQTSKTDDASALPTLHSLSILPQQSATTSKLFSSCTFWLSRETSRPIFQFIVSSFGGRIGWPATSGGGSPFDETDESITHVIIDRPITEAVLANETPEQRARRARRKFIQPQWVVDSINAGKLLLEDHYAQGKTLPPHLSPFQVYEGVYDPTADIPDAEMDEVEGEDEEAEEEAEDADENEEDNEDDEGQGKGKPEKKALQAAAVAQDAAALRAAELEAEAAGVDFGTFEKEARKARKKAKEAEAKEEAPIPEEENMNKMLMSNKKRKLYERMKYSQKKAANERETLQQRKKALVQQEKKKKRSAT